MDTYEEPIGRYRILRHEELPDDHKAAMRIAGTEPDDCWSLIWSFEDKAAADEQLERCIEKEAEWQTHKLVDAGPDAPKTITRTAWF